MLSFFFLYFSYPMCARYFCFWFIILASKSVFFHQFPLVLNDMKCCLQEARQGGQAVHTEKKSFGSRNNKRGFLSMRIVICLSVYTSNVDIFHVRSEIERNRMPQRKSDICLVQYSKLSSEFFSCPRVIVYISYFFWWLPCVAIPAACCQDVD